jgi:hypothetical protein
MGKCPPPSGGGPQLPGPGPAGQRAVGRRGAGHTPREGHSYEAAPPRASHQGTRDDRLTRRLHAKRGGAARSEGWGVLRGKYGPGGEERAARPVPCATLGGPHSPAGGSCGCRGVPEGGPAAYGRDGSCLSLLPLAGGPRGKEEPTAPRHGLGLWRWPTRHGPGRLGPTPSSQRAAGLGGSGEEWRWPRAARRAARPLTACTCRPPRAPSDRTAPRQSIVGTQPRTNGGASGVARRRGRPELSCAQHTCTCAARGV